MTSPEKKKRKADDDEPRDDTARAAKAAGVLGGILTVLAFAFYGWKPGASVFIGSAIAVANLLTMRAIIRSVLQAPPEEEEDPADDAGDTKTSQEHKAAGRRGGVAWGVFAVLKIVILFGGVWFLLTKQLVDPIPLVVGYGVLPLGIAASSLFSSLKPR